MATNNAIDRPVATQADQETGTSAVNYIATSVQQYHQSAAKAWVMASTAGAAAASYNVTSVGDTGAGVVTVNFTVNFSSASYTVTGALENNVAGSAATTQIFNIRTPKAASNFVADCVNANTWGGTDAGGYYHFSCFGDIDT